MQFIAIPVLALAATSVAARRPSRRSSYYPPAPPPPTGDGSYHYGSTSESTSTATCTAEVSATTSSEARAALVDLYAEVMTGYCQGYDHMDVKTVAEKVKAIAKLTLESKITCNTSGKYAYACGDTWVGATSFAGAAYEAYAAAWAKVAEEYECYCGSELTASADVSLSSFGELWAKIYAALDNYGCAGSGNEYTELSEAFDQEQKLECTATLIYNVWAKATAGAWVTSECVDMLPTRCETCCISDDGADLPDCDCDAWTEQCINYMTNYASAKATAEITVDEVKNLAECKGNVTDAINDTVQELTPVFVYTPVPPEAPGNQTIECDAYAETRTYASAASAQANATVDLVGSLCDVSMDAPALVSNHSHAIAEVIAEVYSKVTADCSFSGDVNLEYDGGCGFASTWVKAFASACAEAFADAFAEIKFGNKTDDTPTCDCNLGGAALAEALASETQQIHAQVSQYTDALACTDPGVGLSSEYARKCIAKSTAELYAQAVAKILLTNDCVSADKVAYCETECRDIHSNGWDYCIKECTQAADANAEAFADSIATITLTNDVECSVEAFNGIVYFDDPSVELTPDFDTTPQDTTGGATTGP